MPIIELRLGPHGKRVHVKLPNLGRGPALNFRIWAKLLSEDGGVEATSGCSIGEAIGTGQTVDRALDFSERHLDFGNRGDDLEIVAEYTDVHKRGFCPSVARMMHRNGAFEVKGSFDLTKGNWGKPMAEGRAQLDKVMEMVGVGSTRRIRLTVLALSGIVLQALVYWYAAQTAGKEWGALGIQVWAFAVGAWMLIVGIGLARLRKHLKDMQKGRPSERNTNSL